MSKETSAEMAYVLHKDICEEAYVQVEKMIHQICWQFQLKFGGDIEDWLSEAHIVFMECIAAHDPKRSQFITWLWNHLRWRFIDIVRQRIRHSKIKFVSIHQTDDSESMSIDNFIPCYKYEPCFMMIIEQASIPVQDLWNIINYPPPELIEEIDACNPEVSWDAIQHYLNYHLKWPWHLIRLTIKELKDICST